MGLGQLADLMGSWQERGEGVFEGGDWYSNAHYDTDFLLLNP